MDAGVTEQQASQHGQDLERGSALVLVQAEGEEAGRAEAIMDAGMPVIGLQPEVGEEVSNSPPTPNRATCPRLCPDLDAVPSASA